jgi:Vitamin K-dependent gamma-carboxylase
MQNIINFFLHYDVHASFCAFLRFISCSFLVFCLFWARKDAWNFSKPDGVFDIKTYKKFANKDVYPMVSLFDYFTSSTSHAIIFYSYFIFGIFAAVGFLTNISLLLFFILLYSMQNRIMIIQSNGGEYVARIIVLCLALTNCGSLYSVDHLLGLSNGHKIVDGWAIRLIQLNIVVIYFFSAMYKLRDKYWVDKATIIRNCMYSPVWGKRLFLKFFSIPLVYKTLAYSTVAFEYFAPLLFFIPETRILSMLAGISLHLGISIFMRIGYFGPIMIIADLSFADQLFK